MRILVTGNLGTIGRHVVPRLLNCGHAVSGLDRRTSVIEDPRVRQFTVDICNRDGFLQAVRRAAPEAIVHLAARTDLNEKRNLEGYAANIEGVQNLIDAARDTPTVRRVICTSSQLVCKVGHVPSSPTEYCPHTLYGESKVRTEQLVRDADGGGATWCLVRPTTVWGPHMSAHYRRMLALIEAGRYFHVGREPLWKSYSYAGNIAYQYERLCVADGDAVHRKTFYLADYEPLCLQEWTNALAREFGRTSLRTYPRGAVSPLAWAGDALNVVGVRFPFNSFRLRNILTSYVFDLTATQEVCGPLPFGQSEGVAATVAWYRSQRQWPELPRQRAA